MTNLTHAAEATSAPPAARPRVGFAGVGWIGRARLEALAESGRVQVAAVADPDPGARDAAVDAAGKADDAHVARLDGFERLLEEDLDAVVIATPSAQHARQALAALERGVAVFCQKPLGRTAAETRRVVDVARERDLLLGVDFSYRHLRAARAVRELVSGGDLGDVYAADLVFHNAYGPDKMWFYDPARSGGGCLIDLGIHLVDLALHTLGFPEVEGAAARLYAAGRPWTGEGVEDYVEARLDLASGATVRIACSWRLPAGQDAVIGAAFYGTEGAARLRNVDGSFYDFAADRLTARRATPLVEPPDDWGGRGIRSWAETLAGGSGFDPCAREAVTVADVIDRLYGRQP